MVNANKQTCPSLWLFCSFGFLTSSSTTRLYPKTERLTILRAATHETELGDHDFCISRSHYTDTDPTSRDRVATAGIEPGTSTPGVARSPPYGLEFNNSGRGHGLSTRRSEKRPCPPKCK